MIYLTASKGKIYCVNTISLTTSLEVTVSKVSRLTKSFLEEKESAKATSNSDHDGVEPNRPHHS